MAQDLDIGMKCIKYMLFVANFMFVMVGVLLISFGSTIKSIYYDFELFMEDYYFSPAKLTIAIGIIILMISAFGCAAAIKESTCMVNMYAVLLTLVLVLELSTAIAAYTMRVNINGYMEGRMKTAMKNYNNDSEVREAFGYLQSAYQCCGINSPIDWTTIANTTIPKSCCIPLSEPGVDHCEPYERNCLDMLTSIMTQSSVMLGTGALCITIVQVLGIAFAVMLAKSIRRIKTERAVQRWQSRQELYLQLARGNDKNNQPTPVPVTYTAEQNASSA